MPSILFSHQNFPAQFGAFGGYLAQSGWDVTFATSKPKGAAPKGCKFLAMAPHRQPAKSVHRFASGLEKAMINGQAFANAAIKARDLDGLDPDIVMAHSGWGSGTFCKAVWPNCKYVAYVEWYYRWPSLDIPTENVGRSQEDLRARALARNAPTLLDLAEADLVLCPTEFQARQFPTQYRQNMVVQHDGVNISKLARDKKIAVNIGKRTLGDEAEIITYATRGMEPHRGFPQFMRALEKLQKQRPNLHAIIGGQDKVSYGVQLPDQDSWKRRMLSELDLDLKRVHFVGLLPHSEFGKLLRSASVHVYFTVPFVPSWSLIEAMSVGCPMVVSKNAAVEEALEHGKSALMVDHDNQKAVVKAVNRLLDDRKLAADLGQAAQQKARTSFDAAWIWPARAEMLQRLIRT